MAMGCIMTYTTECDGCGLCRERIWWDTIEEDEEDEEDEDDE